jgi:hypothetical protein
VEKYGKENLVVVLGSPDADSSELYAETLINGDPAWMGPLAGVALDLPVYHVLEPVIKDQIDPEISKEHLGLMEIALDVDGITKGLNRARKKE